MYVVDHVIDPAVVLLTSAPADQRGTGRTVRGRTSAAHAGAGAGYERATGVPEVMEVEAPCRSRLKFRQA
jgi:hypothetical protein